MEVPWEGFRGSTKKEHFPRRRRRRGSPLQVHTPSFVFSYFEELVVGINQAWLLFSPRTNFKLSVSVVTSHILFDVICRSLLVCCFDQFVSWVKIGLRFQRSAENGVPVKHVGEEGGAVFG